VNAVFQLKIWRIWNCILFLQKQNQINRFMGSVYEKEAQPVQKKRGSVKSKGDRLGWTPFNEVVRKPLKEVMGEIRILTDENMYRLKGVKPLL
jgi:hypothetical protein